MITLHLNRKARWLGAASGLVLAAALAPPAFADPDPLFENECSGAAIAGNGASFQKPHQDGWINAFINGVSGVADPICSDFEFPSSGPASIVYDSQGSGAGRRAMGERSGSNTTGARSATYRFSGTDEAPNATQQGQMNAGLDAAGDEGQVRVIPIEAGAITISVNFPDGCTIPSGLQYRPNADGTTRFTADNFTLEAVWYGEIATWGDFVPGIGGAGCASKPIVRVRRSDSSGTTFAFKDWLGRIDASDGSVDRDPSWEFYRQDANNTVWPGTTTGAAQNEGVAATVRQTDGSIGYVELGAARNAGFDKTGVSSTTAGGNTTPANDTTFWLPIQNGSGQFRDPQTAADGYRDVTRPKGANCAGVTYTGIPGGADPTTANWASVSGVNSSTAYGICTLTYALAWSDYCDVYGSSDAEQAKWRSVFDYLNFVTSNTGQTLTSRLDASPLPASLRSVAQTATSRIGWREPGGSCS